MRRIEDWLGEFGLGEYASRFVENKIGFDILGDLTDQDLEKIGVALLGDRRRLLRAISDLNASPAKKQSRSRNRRAPRRKGAVPTAEPEPLPAQILRQCGDDLSRGNVMKQATNLNNFHSDNLLAGITISSSPSDYRLIKRMRMTRFNGKIGEPLGEIIAAE